MISNSHIELQNVSESLDTTGFKYLNANSSVIPHKKAVLKNGLLFCVFNKN